MLWLQTNTLFSVPAILWVYAITAATLSFWVFLGFLRFLLTRLERLASRTSSSVDDIFIAVIKRTHKLTIFVASWLIGVRFLTLTPPWDERVNQLWFVVIGLQLALWVNQGVSVWSAARLSGKDAGSHNPVTTTMVSWLMRVLLWSMLLLAVLANTGVDITAFVASLGVGGIAVALAVQNILSDVFASAAIGLDKPFEIGDFVVFGDVAGSVEQIGLKTTRIRSIGGEEIVCSNTELLKNTIRNYKRMRERRILFTFGLTYDAQPEEIKRVPDIVRAAIECQNNTRFDRAHFKHFGDSSLDFEVVYYVTDARYNVYMDIQQAVNLSLMAELTAAGLAFAFPTRTVHLANSHTMAA